jgi:hypothetical protein
MLNLGEQDTDAICAEARPAEAGAPFPSRSATIFEPNERALKPRRKRDAHWSQAPR